MEVGSCARKNVNFQAKKMIARIQNNHIDNQCNMRWIAVCSFFFFFIIRYSLCIFFFSLHCFVRLRNNFRNTLCTWMRICHILLFLFKWNNRVYFECAAGSHSSIQNCFDYKCSRNDDSEIHTFRIEIYSSNQYGNLF